MSTESSNTQQMRQRTQEELADLLSLAKIAPSEVQPVAQCLHFAKQMDDDQLMLIELDEALLSQLLEGSEKLEVKGESDQDAVLCTNSCTYEVREVETSNSLMLSTDMLLPPDTATEGLGGHRVQMRRCHASAVKRSYLELRRIRPGPAVLRTLLEAGSYRGLVEEAEYPERAYAAPMLDELKRRIQISDSELDHLLANLGTVQLDGRVRLLHEEQPHQVLTAVLAVAAENDWSLDRLPVEEVCAAVADLHDPRVTRAVIDGHRLVEGTAGPLDNSSNVTVTLDPRLVSRSFGHFLLRLASAYKLQVFMQLWQEAVSDAASVSLDHLTGLCLVEESDATIRYFPADRLPDSLPLRFAELFKAKAKWTHDEMLLYLEAVCFDKITPGSLLARYARVSNANGKKYYSAR